MTKQQKAFTLVELAIVITIIGLLIGGVLKGQELLENARMTSMQNQIKSYQAALITFRDIYKAMPGDMVNARDFITGCTAGNNCINGDGNGQIAGASGFEDYWYHGFDGEEAFQTWKQLALAGLITGVDTSVARPGAYIAGTHIPASAYRGMVYIKTVTPGPVHTGDASFTGLIILPSSQSTNGISLGSKSPQAALKIDLKIDDGIALSGEMHSVSGGFTLGCGTSANGATGYNVNVSGTPCEVAYRLQP